MIAKLIESDRKQYTIDYTLYLEEYYENYVRHINLAELISPADEYLVKYKQFVEALEKSTKSRTSIKMPESWNIHYKNDYTYRCWFIKCLFSIDWQVDELGNTNNTEEIKFTHSMVYIMMKYYLNQIYIDQKQKMFYE